MSFEDLVATLRHPSYGDWAHGGDPEGTAQDWIEHGQADQMQAWLDAGCWDAAAAARLAALGVTPDQVDFELYLEPGRPGSLGYWVANGDISAERAARIVRGEEPRPA